MTEPVASPVYGFGGRLSAAFPSQVIIDLTEVCNLACSHCPHAGFQASPRYGRHRLDPALNAKVVDEIRDRGAGQVQYLRYTAEGEPLTHPDCYDMIEDAVRRSGVFVTLTTNGTLMRGQGIRRLIDSGVDMIDVSIDAHRPETYRQIRVGGDLERTRTNVLDLLETIRRSGAKTKVVVSFIEQDLNRGEAAAFEQYWTEQGVERVVIRRLHSAAGAVSAIAQTLQDGLADKPRRPCVYPWERIVLTPRGHLAFCPDDWVGGSILADYRDTSIATLWNGEAYRALRADHLRGDYTQQTFCRDCPDWAQTRWPEEGPAYATMIAAMTLRKE